MFQELDKLIADLKGLEEFLASPAAIDAYFAASQKYYGERVFPRKHYDALLTQLQEMQQKIPNLSEILWREIPLAQNFSFSFDLERSTSRGMHAEAWSNYLLEWKNTLAQQFTLTSEEDFQEKARAILQKEKAASEAFLHALEKEPLTEKERKIKKNQFFKESCEKKELNEIAARMIFRQLEQDHTVTVMESMDAEIILALLRDWRTNPRLVAPFKMSEVADPVISLIRDRLPTIPELLSRSDIFFLRKEEKRDEALRDAKGLKAGIYHIEPVPRIFHAIWRGIAVGDCMCMSEEIYYPTPRRWLAALLDGAQTLHIKTDVSYHGAVFLWSLEKDAERWYAIEFWSQILSLFVVEKGRQPQSSQPFYLRLLQELQKRLPAGIQGFCIDNSRVFDNWSIAKILSSGAVFQMGKTIGKQDSFHLPTSSLEEMVSSGEQKISPLVAKKFREKGTFLCPGRVLNAELVQLWIPD